MITQWMLDLYISTELLKVMCFLEAAVCICAEGKILLYRISMSINNHMLKFSDKLSVLGRVE